MTDDGSTRYPGAQAARTPERPAVIMAGTGEVVTYAELDRRSAQLAHVLRDGGLRRGDRLAVLVENHASYLEAAWAGLRSGLYVVPINTYLTAAEVAYIVDDSEAKALVTSARLAAVAEGVDDDLLRRIPVRLMVESDSPSFASYEASIAAAPPIEPADESAGTYLFYSSGTTGRPKGVVRALPDGPPGRADARIERLADLYGFRDGMVYLSPAPLYHAAPLGMSVSAQRYGGTVVIMERFDPADAIRLIERYRVTHSQWVPTMFVRLLRLSGAERAASDLSSHEAAIHAAAPCPYDVKRRMIEWWGPILFEYYSATERSGTTYITSQQWLEHPGSVGRSLAGEIRIIDESGRQVGPGEVGVVYFAGGEPFDYLHDPDKTAASRLTGGLSTMGDVGYVDADGWLYLTDRQSDLIISGGVNIYPRESEDVLIGHPSVADVAVFGVPDDDLGEAVKAVVELVPGVEATAALEAELLAFARDRLAAFKCPRSVDFEDSLPRQPSGKLYKRLLRDRYWGRSSAGIVGVLESAGGQPPARSEPGE